jgi:hypothetical protein
MVGERSDSRTPGFQALRQPLVWALLLLSFAVGRLSVRTQDSHAQLPASPPVAGGLAPHLEGPRFDPSGSLGGAALTEMTRALADPANRYTVLAVTYVRTNRNHRWAQDYVSHFAGQDLPVAPPQIVDDQILVLVGASPSKEGLDELLARVRATPDVGGRQGAFASAYVVPIDERLRPR